MIGKGVERDIDPGVCGEVLFARGDPPQPFDAIRSDALLFESLAHHALPRGGGILRSDFSFNRAFGTARRIADHRSTVGKVTFDARLKEPNVIGRGSSDSPDAEIEISGLSVGG